MQKEKFTYLFEQYYNKNANDSEVAEFMDFIHSGEFDQQLKQLIDQYYEKFKPVKSPLSTLQEDLILNKILQSSSTQKTVKINKVKRMWAKISIAASILLCIGLGFYLYSQKQYKQEQELAVSLIKPGANKARLVLSNGKVILLDSLSAGMQIVENGVQITKTKDGQLIYSTSNQGEGVENTIETPKGGQYQLRLPDGTQVWLNAASSLKYSSAFKGSKREVELSGEAYFEVVHRDNQPFLVRTSNQLVEVLGTHFNVNAYPDDDIQSTTLLEGSVKTQSKGQTLLLKPAEQSVLNLKNHQFKKEQANLESVMAWKNGDFIFKDENLASVMKKVERWYNVEVVFEDIDPTAIQLGGWVSRSKNIGAVIKIIEPIANVHIKVEGRRVTVMK